MQLTSAPAPAAYIYLAAKNKELPRDVSLFGWWKIRLVGIFWEGPGDFCTLDREDVRRTTVASDKSSPSGCATPKALCSLVEMSFQVLYSVKRDRASVGSEHEARYVAQMAEFLFLGTGGMSFQSRYQRGALFKPSKPLESGEGSHDQKQARMAYSLRMKPGRVVNPADLLVLRCDGSGRRVLFHDLEAPLESLLKFAWTELTELPEDMREALMLDASWYLRVLTSSC